MTLKFVAAVRKDDSIERVLAEDETIQLKGGERFITMERSEAADVLKRELVFVDGKPVFSDEDLEKLTAHCRAKSTLNGMTARNRRRLLRKLELKRDNLNPVLAKRRDYLDLCISVLNELEAWCKLPLKLEKPSGSRFHKFMEAAGDGDLIMMVSAAKEEINPRHYSRETYKHWGDASVFVVEHNWAAAFEKATDFVGGDFRLPDGVCAFEFRISGMHVVALAHQPEDGGKVQFYPMIEAQAGFVMLPVILSQDGTSIDQDGEPLKSDDTEKHFFHAGKLIAAQLRAISIALDASVAQTNVVHADRKLNAARERSGHLPIYAYHVVSLANRHQARPVPVEPGEFGGPRKALHFVRGHRRNIDQSVETMHACPHSWSAYDSDGRSNCPACHARSRWINWHLRGDPDLGFIDKHYKL